MVTPDVGVYGRVIKNGGAFDQPMTIAALIEDDEDGGTWVDVITNPEANEHLNVRALNKYSEQDARNVSAQRRNIYVSWVDDPQPEPTEPSEA